MARPKTRTFDVDFKRQRLRLNTALESYHQSDMGPFRPISECIPIPIPPRKSWNAFSFPFRLIDFGMKSHSHSGVVNAIPFTIPAI